MKATVLEARTAGSGASGRNGGFVIAGTAPFHNDARAALRARARAPASTQPRSTRSATVLEIAEELGARELFEQRGSLRLAVDSEESAHLLEDVEALHEDGFPAELVTGDDLPVELRGPGRSGYVTAEDCAVQPARWIRAFADGAEARGARIFEHTPVAAPLGARDGAAFVLRTPRARHARRARGRRGRRRAADPRAGRSRPNVRSKRLHMVATAPTDARARAASSCTRAGATSTTTRRPRAASRSAATRTSTARAPTPTPTARSRRRWCSSGSSGTCARSSASRLPVTHRWVGLVGYGPDERPLAGPVPGEDGLYVLGGYNGTGNLNGFVAGRIVAELIARGSRPMPISTAPSESPRAEARTVYFLEAFFEALSGFSIFCWTSAGASERACTGLSQ